MDETSISPKAAPGKPKPKAVTTSRSPTYPATDAQDAFERAKKVSDVLRNGSGSAETLAVAMGYSGLNGTSRVMISTGKKYGLYEDTKDGIRLTEDAKAIVMLPQEDPRFISAVKRCSLKPAIFAELYETYGFDLPAEQSLKFLLVSKGFVQEAAVDVIRSYKHTLEFLRRIAPNIGVGDGDANSEPSDGDAKEEPVVQASRKPTERRPDMAATPETMFYAPVAELRLTLPGGCKAHVIFEGNVTQEAVERLRVYLEFFAEDQPSMKSAAQLDQAASAKGTELDEEIE